MKPFKYRTLKDALFCLFLCAVTAIVIIGISYLFDLVMLEFDVVRVNFCKASGFYFTREEIQWTMNWHRVAFVPLVTITLFPLTYICYVYGDE